MQSSHNPRDAAPLVQLDLGLDLMSMPGEAADSAGMAEGYPSKPPLAPRSTLKYRRFDDNSQAIAPQPRPKDPRRNKRIKLT